MRRFLLCTALWTAAAPGQTTCHDLGPFHAVAQQAVAQLQLPGMVLRLDQHGQTVYLQAFGTHQTSTAMPIASGSKALAAAVLLSLVDQGLVGLDDPVGSYLPEYATGPKAAITLRMCFAHTSGLPDFDPVTTSTAITMRQAAAQIAQMPLQFPPGTGFAYGNVSMQVAGAVCEVVTGVPWHQLFQQRVAAPLGMSATAFAAPPLTSNPGVGDGAVSNAEDYSRFLDMLRRGGERNGVRVLSAASVQQMLIDQIGNRTIVSSPHPAGAACGLGLWIERQDPFGRTLLACAPGAFGFFGWLDLEHDATGTWLATTYFAWSYPFVQAAWEATDVALEPLGVQCAGASSPSCAAGPRFHAATWTRDGQPDFGVAVVGAPPSAFGLALFGYGPPGAGLTMFDLVDYVPNAVALLPMSTDAAGAGTLSFVLPPGLVGLTFTMQGAWGDPATCGVSGLLASRALRFDVLP
jgi:CubicO group peptidase (beta-lactamase class C family)